MKISKNADFHSRVKPIIALSMQLSSPASASQDENDDAGTCPM